MSEENQIQMVMLPVAEEQEVKSNKAETIPYPVSHADKVFAAVMFVLGYFAMDSFSFFMNHAYYGAGVTAYTFLYGAACFCYARMSGQKAGKEAVFWFGVMGVSAVSYLFVYHQTLMVFHALFLRLVTLYFTAVVFGGLIAGRTSSFFFWDGINLLVLIPFGNRKAQWRAVGDSGRYDSLLHAVLKALLGLVVAIPLFYVVIMLLSGADGNYAGLLHRLLKQLGERFYGWGMNLLLAVPVGAYLFALCYGGLHKRKTDSIKKEEIRQLCTKCAVVPQISIYVVLIGICFLYVLFIGLQGSYYLDAVRGILPEGFTYSEYARRGFFELVNISILNVCIILAARLFGRKGKKLLLRLGTVAVSVLTLFLIGTAMTKMFLYIRAYGLTPLRVIPSLFMAFLAVVFVLIIAAQFWRVQVVPIAVCLFAVGYALLSVSNMDGRIARYNLARYQAGTLESFPKTVLQEGSLASVPAVYQMWAATDDGEQKEMLKSVAENILWYYGADCHPADSLKEANAARSRALRNLKAMGLENPVLSPPHLVY